LEQAISATYSPDFEGSPPAIAMSKIGYFDCIGGISGDMALASVIDAGADAAEIVAGLRTLGLPGWELCVSRVRRSTLDACRVEVQVGGRDAGDAPLVDSPSSSPGRVSGHERAPAHSHTHSHFHDHASEHIHTHTHGEGQGQREGVSRRQDTSSFSAISALIRASGLPPRVKERAEAVYHRLASAEAIVHGHTIESVHFHEVGAVDSVVDVVGAVLALELLGVDTIYCSALPTGHGFVRCAHGLMPNPPPATAALLRGAPLRAVDVAAELVTPTGAALVATLASGFGPLPSMTLESIGYGAGKKEFSFPNLTRFMVGEAGVGTDGSEDAAVTLIEANIDDQNPQLYQDAFDRLFAAGALDVWLTPILMKKNRPAHTLSVLCRLRDRESVSEAIFAATTTLGVRFGTLERTCLDREWLEVATAYGSVRLKVARRRGSVRTVTPEYDECRRCAEAAGVPVKMVQAAAAAAAWSILEAG
jgi:uncharacterized protein (TIGR00299 family) protein